MHLSFGVNYPTLEDISTDISYTLDTFEKIRVFPHISDFMVAVMIGYQDGTSTTINTKEMDPSKFYPYYPGIQAQIDISKYIENNTLREIVFWFKNIVYYSMIIELDDASWDTVRPLYKRRMRQKGAKIGLEKGEYNVAKTYFTTIRQIVHEEDDKSINCKNYPNEEFESYKDCDMAFTRQAYQSLYHQNNCSRGHNISTKRIVPIFATNKFDEVTKVLNIDCAPFFATDLMTGTTSSPCPMPCTSSFTDTMEASIENKEEEKDKELISIKFDNSVSVTRIKVDNFQIMESLNFLGSNLGLWPGLGIFQMIQWVFRNISWGILIRSFTGNWQNVN